MRSGPALAVSDTIVVMIPALVARGGVGFRLADLFPERHGFTVMVGSGRPLSRGHILLRSSDPTAHPRIFPEYFSELEDLRALARSVRRMRDMMREPAIREACSGLLCSSGDAGLTALTEQHPCPKIEDFLPSLALPRSFLPCLSSANPVTAIGFSLLSLVHRWGASGAAIFRVPTGPSPGEFGAHGGADYSAALGFGSFATPRPPWRS
jgi:hypothetical protein